MKTYSLWDVAAPWTDTGNKRNPGTLASNDRPRCSRQMGQG